jgi:hypothetical protein
VGRGHRARAAGQRRDGTVRLQQVTFRSKKERLPGLAASHGQPRRPLKL